MIVGVILILASLMLLGASAAAVFGRVPTGGRLIKLGLLCCFGGGFLIFDTVNLTFWSEWNIINTYGLILCQFMAVYMMGLLARDSLTGKRRQAASIAAVLSGAVVTGIILISCLGPVLIYDTLFLWTAVQLPVNIFLMILGILELADRSRKPGRDAVFFPLLFLCLTVDMTGITKSIFCQGSLTKAGILIYLICTFFKAAGDIISDHKASARAEKLEQELEQSRIAVMLSQIHPHFIFNVLGTIRGLCREDPEQAWQAIGDFSSYLRGNMNALTNTSSIPFDSELLHVQTYLRLEQLRLGEKLRIVYDIREKDFCLPPLTLQPLVENAVKHGIFYKKEGGTVTIRTIKEEDRILIRVEDDGLGFDPQQAALNARTHEPIGITNVCNRVKTMLGGTLTLDSNPGCGTAVTIAFPYSNNERGA